LRGAASEEIGAKSRSVKLALLFAKIAREDARASAQLYTSSFIPQAIFAFQQAVEKDAKSIGLLMGSIKPTPADLKKVSHMSLLSLLLGMPEMLDRLPAIQKVIQGKLEGPKLKRFHLAEAFQPILKPPTISSDNVRKAIQQIRGIDKGRAWKLSVTLDPKEKFTQTIDGMLMTAEQKWNEADQAESVLRKLEKIMRGEYKIEVDHSGTRYFINIGVRAINEAVPLTLLTMWHEQETRYPPVSESDYWDVGMYTKSSGLVRRLHQLYQHLDRLSLSTLAGARCARRITLKESLEG
jgi:hypothetical protein